MENAFCKNDSNTSVILVVLTGAFYFVQTALNLNDGQFSAHLLVWLYRRIKSFTELLPDIVKVTQTVMFLQYKTKFSFIWQYGLAMLC